MCTKVAVAPEKIHCFDPEVFEMLVANQVALGAMPS